MLNEKETLRGKSAENEGQLSKTRPCHLRWFNVTKVVEVKNAYNGFLRSSIASHPENSSSVDTPKHKVILNKVSGEAEPSQIMALMGPSGSGKTTLLDILATRSQYTDGTITLNSSTITDNSSKIKSLKRKIAYIKQKDVFFEHLTVQDQLMYTAFLRLGNELTKDDKMKEVERVLHLLRLEKCANTPIKLISGGERKRVNIGTELLTNPSIILLDEPTSGLDSTSAVALMSLLRSLAHNNGKTIITSIHQPSSAVYHQFDKCMVLADGFVTFLGSPAESLPYLQQLDLSVPEGYNVADYWMDLLVGTSEQVFDSSLREEYNEEKKDESFVEENSLSVINGNESKNEQERFKRKSSIFDSFTKGKGPSIVQLTTQSRSEHACKTTPKARLINAWSWDDEANGGYAQTQDVLNGSSHSSITDKDNLSLHSEKKFNTSWHTQFFVLTHRSLKNSRSAIFTTLNLTKSVMLGLIMGLLWFQMPYTEKYVNDRSSYFFLTNTYWIFDAMFGALFSFPSERELIYKERASGCYHLSAYFMAKTLSEFPTRMSLPGLYMVISYWLSGANPKFEIFISTTCITLLSVMAGESIGLLISTLVMDFEKAMVIMVVASISLMVSGGFYVENPPAFLTWVTYLSPFTYSYDACQILVFDKNVPCDGSGILEVVCGVEFVDYATPEQVLEYLNVQGSVSFNIGLLFVLFIIPRYFAFLALKLKKGEERS